MICLFCENDDHDKLSSFITEIGVNSFFPLIPDLIKSGVNDSVLSPHLNQAPSDKKILLSAAEELEAQGRLELFTPLLESCEWKDDDKVLLFRVKLICLQSNIEQFCDFVSAHDKVWSRAKDFI